MKIVSFNIQHAFHYVEKKINFEALAKAIVDLGADVVGLNEVRGAGIDPDYTAQTETLARLAGFPHFFFAKAIDTRGGPYGNAILSKLPILAAEAIPIPDPSPRAYTGYYETRCVLKATLAGGLTVLVTHFGLNPDEQENAVRTALSQLSGEKDILMGDFNLTPESPLLAPIRAKMRDTAECFAGERFSFPSDAPTRKIDYIFASPDLSVTAADIPPVVVSDHRPHIAEISLT